MSSEHPDLLVTKKALHEGSIFLVTERVRKGASTDFPHLAMFSTHKEALAYIAGYKAALATLNPGVTHAESPTRR